MEGSECPAALHDSSSATRRVFDVSMRLQSTLPQHIISSSHITNCSLFESVLSDMTQSQLVLDRKRFGFRSINALPNEILGRVFDLMLTAHIPREWGRRWYHEHNRLLTISSVCCRWRQLAIQTSSYWSHVNLEGIQLMQAKIDHPIDRIRLWLERSRGSPIHIHLPRSDDRLTNTRQREAVISILQPHARLISSLISTIYLDEPLILTIYALLMHKEKFGSIKILAFSVMRRSYASAQPWQQFINFTGLVHLDLDYVTRLAVDNLATILVRNPRIRALRLRNMSISTKTEMPCLAIRLADLQLLDTNELDSPGLQWLMTVLHPGALELDVRLDVTHLASIESSVLRDFFARANVVCLWLFDSPSSWDSPSKVYFPLLPAVRTLGLVCDFDFEILDKMVVSVDGSQVARYPTVRVLCLTGQGELRGSCILETAQHYSLNLLNLDCSCFLGDEDRSSRAQLSQRVGRITEDSVEVNFPDFNMDIYTQTLMNASRVA